MSTNTGHKHISQTAKGYVFTLPETLALLKGVKTVQRQRLQDVLNVRNMMFGYDPDKGPQPTFKPVNQVPLTGDFFRFGAIGDTHLCNRYELLPELWMYYKEVAALGVKHVLNAGNWVDGDKYLDNVHTFGMDRQIDYFLRNYPQVKGVTTWLLTAPDHEGHWMKTAGADAGKVAVERQKDYGRADLKFLGYREANLTIPHAHGDITVQVRHGGGGSSKNISYAAQKVIDGMHPDEKPDILVLGHYHKADFLPDYRGVFAVQTGTFEGQTDFMRSIPTFAHVGGWVVDVGYVNKLLRVSARYLKYKARTPWRSDSIVLSDLGG